MYPQLAISDSSKIGVRTEYFKELGYIGAIGSRVGNSYLFAATLTGNYKVGDLIIIPEIRLDSSSDNFTLNTNLSPNSSLSSFLLAAVYKF